MSKKVVEADVLIIGTGPIGATYARCLASCGRSVTMIDSGPQLRRRPGEHLLNTFQWQHEPNLSLDEMFAQREVFSVPNPPNNMSNLVAGGPFNPPQERLNFSNPEQNPNLNMPDAAVMYAVGGMFSLWSAYAPIPTASERTPYISGEDWELMIPLAKEFFNVHTDAFEPSAVSRAMKRLFHDSTRTLENMPMGAESLGSDDQTWYVRWTGSDTILGPLMAEDGTLADGVEILEEHRAEELVLSKDKTKVLSATVRDLKRREVKEFKAKTFIVAGGSFLGARLLWQSHIRPWALGRFLSENPVVTCNMGMGDKIVDLLREDSDNPAKDDVVPVAWNDPPPKNGFVPTDEHPWLIHFNRTGRSMTYDLSVDVRLTMAATAYSTVDQIPENRLLFSDKYMDRFGQPQITIDYRVPDQDVDLAMRMLADVNELCAKIGPYGPMSRPPHTVGPSIQPPGTSLHLMGTFRMGTDEKTSVVDPDCRVWGVDNLYAGGEGVISNRIASNPTLTCGAIAIRSSASILGLTMAQLTEKLTPQG